MPVTVHLTGERFADLPLSTEDLMRDVGLLARELILRRVASGISLDGGSFAPYSPAYAKAKGQALGGGPVNLQVSGQMLQGLVVTDVTHNSVTIGFSN